MKNLKLHQNIGSAHNRTLSPKFVTENPKHNSGTKSFFLLEVLIKLLSSFLTHIYIYIYIFAKSARIANRFANSSSTIINFNNGIPSYTKETR